MDKLEIYQSEFSYSDWDDKDYVPSELNVTLSQVDLAAMWSQDTSYRGLGVRITYGLEYNSQRIFTFTGEKQFSFPVEYISIHFLSFLIQVSISEFHEQFMYMRSTSKVKYNKFFTRTVEELFDELAQVLDVIRLDGPPNV